MSFVLYLVVLVHLYLQAGQVDLCPLFLQEIQWGPVHQLPQLIQADHQIQDDHHYQVGLVCLDLLADLVHLEFHLRLLVQVGLMVPLPQVVLVHPLLLEQGTQVVLGHLSLQAGPLVPFHQSHL